MSNGVIMLNAGTKCLIRLITSIHSLRKHYIGDITVMQVGDMPFWATKILAQMGVDIKPLPVDGVHPLVKKTMLWRHTPYSITLFIDADTLVVKPIDIIFKKMQKHDFAVYNFAGWKSNGGMIKARIMGFKGVCSEKELKDAVEYGPAVNTGIFAFKMDSPFLPAWEELTVKGGKNNCSRIPDEIACQILLPKFQPKILPPSWGVSVKYSTEEQIKDAVIIHYHGMKHCLDYPLCGMWKAEYLEVVKKFAVPELRMNWEDKRLGRFQKAEGIYIEQETYDIIENAKKEEEEHYERIVQELIETKVDVKLSQPNREITYVTAVNSAYLEKLKKNYPLWMKVRGIRKKKFIIFARSDIMNKLGFLNKRATVIPWDYGLKEGYSEREGMLSAFVKAIPKYVKTPYWCKIDADATPKVDRFEWDDKAFECDIAGHKWGYTKSKGAWKEEHFLNTLDKWWNEETRRDDIPGERPIFPDKLPYKERYGHKRIASFLCLHKTEFSIECNDFIRGNRLPVPSHDTLVWYIATRLGKKIGRYNLKRSFSA